MLSTPIPLVSIVIPTYNGMPYLEEAINSILCQDYPYVELIVLDDGSTDSTKDFLKQYQGKFYYESQTNIGQAETLNKGWNMCKGEIIGYLASDDILDPTAISTSVDCFNQNPGIVMTYPDNILINAKSQSITRIAAPDYSKLNLIRTAICQYGVGCFFKKYAFQLAGGWNKKYKIGADYDFFLRLCQYGSFFHISKPLGFYRANELSLSRTKYTPELADECKTIMANYLNTVDDPIILSYRDEITAKLLLVSGRFHWDAGRYRVAIKYLKESFFLYPKLFFRRKTWRSLFSMFFIGMGKRRKLFNVVLRFRQNYFKC